MRASGVLHEAGLYVSAVNPFLIKECGNNSLRKVKTDKADAMKIAKYALDNWAELQDYTPVDTIRYELKTLNRQFQLASKQKTTTANNLIALQEQSFPSIRKLFDSPVRSDGTQKRLMTSGTSIASAAAVRTLLPSATASGATETATNSAWRKPPRCTLWQNLLLCWRRKPPSQKRLFRKRRISSQQSSTAWKLTAVR